MRGGMIWVAGAVMVVALLLTAYLSAEVIRNGPEYVASLSIKSDKIELTLLDENDQPKIVDKVVVVSTDEETGTEYREAVAPTGRLYLLPKRASAIQVLVHGQSTARRIAIPSGTVSLQLHP